MQVPEDEGTSDSQRTVTLLQAQASAIRQL